ncbi:ATP-binding protein [Jeotgalibacillus sp. R-1-5s-1]|uniref:ATP-binding protein n=1 Tax=Jeotgalibacillus sp. R-1-5s-1 TaxID=2555897 RepID=UPI00106B0FA8|nr:ATP-binding protein [Jeotgalibacillus sp. R-1-5s-1]TFD92876.1 PAS domain S-box protein [Jeotgalibacillus sp. R-1-5s-1]
MKLLQSYTFSQIKGLLAAMAGLFLVQIVLILSGIYGWLPSEAYIVIEGVVAIVTLFIGYLIYTRSNSLRSLFKEMEEEEFKMVALIQSMPDFVCFKDGQGRWIRTNDFGLELYGLKGQPYIGKTDHELGKINPFFQEAFDYCMETDEETWQKGETVRTEESFFIETGEYKSFDVIKVPIFYEDGTRKALITLGRDISQQKSAEEQLLRREKLAVAGELASGIAHEIKNPLTSLKGFVQLMKEQPSLPKENIDIMSSEIDRIYAIVDELLVLSKPELRKKEFFSLCDCVGYVINFMKHQAAQKDIRILVEKVDDSEKFVHGDRNQVIQVFINLIKNSIEAMDHGGEIKIRPRVNEKEVYLEIEDTGQGISQEIIDKVSEPFYTTKEKGMGLGLTICHKIIQAHDGTLSFRSKPGKGTTATIILPVTIRKKALPVS